MLASETAGPCQTASTISSFVTMRSRLRTRMDQQREHLRLEPHRFAAAAELETLGVEQEISEGPGHAREYRKIGGFCMKFFRSPSSTPAVERQVTHGRMTTGILQDGSEPWTSTR